MGVHPNVGFTKFPTQGRFLGKYANIIFNYDSGQRITGICIRDDVEEPWTQLFLLTNGRVVSSAECQWQPDPDRPDVMPLSTFAAVNRI
jgi:hypothetical protein